MDKATVGICIPAYNFPQKLKRLLSSIAIQSYTDYAIYVSDDSTSDECQDVISQYPELRIIYHRNDHRVGPTCNTNNALKLAYDARVAFIKVMHTDDYFLNKDCLGAFVELLNNNPNAIIAFSSTMEFNDSESKERAISATQIGGIINDWRNIFLGNYIGAPSATIIRNKSIYMYDELKWYVDIEWYMSHLSIRPSLTYTNTPLVGIDTGDGRVTNECLADPYLIMRESYKVLKKHPEMNKPEYYSKVLGDVGLYIDSIFRERVRSKKRHFVYGTGEKAHNCLVYCEENDISIDGIIVSDGQKKRDEFDGYKIVELSKAIDDEIPDTIFIVAVNERNKICIQEECNKYHLNYCFFDLW